MPSAWNAIVLAAGPGPQDPMARAYGTANKCTIPVGGVPMLVRVVRALRQSECTASIAVSIEDPALAGEGLGGDVHVLTSANSAPASVLAAIAAGDLAYPVLVTTGDHALLTPEMLHHFCAASEASGADFTVGLARAETIQAAYPETRRTYFRLGPDQVSGCNLFALRNARALRILERWQYLEQVRKKPWRLVAAFGPLALLNFILGRLTLDSAFATLSAKLGFTARPVIMPFAEAAIDVDKPADKDLAEQIIARRG